MHLLNISRRPVTKTRIVEFSLATINDEIVNVQEHRSRKLATDAT